jgi:signal transduction histidine kinase
MTWIATASVASAAVALYVGVLALRFAIAPGWEAQRAFALVAFTAAGAIAANAVNTLRTADATVVALTRVQLAFLLLHAAAWIRFASAELARPLRFRRWVTGGYVAAAAASLVPGVTFTGEVSRRRLSWPDLEYADVRPTAVGVAFIAGILAMGALVIARYVRAWRQGDRSAGLVAGSLLALSLIGLNDALVTSGVLHGVYLIDVGFLIPIAAVAHDLTTRFAVEARERRRLQDHLEAQVAARTRALEEATRELATSERTSAIARLASGVAHAINSPAAALGTNLRFLLGSLRRGEPASEDAMDTLEDASELTERIGEFVRRLSDASRLAGTEPHLEAISPVESTARHAVAFGWTSEVSPAAVTLDLPEDVHVSMDAPVLVQILRMLLRVTSGDGRLPVRMEARCSGSDVTLDLVATDPEEGGAPGRARERELDVAAGLAGIYGGVVSEAPGPEGRRVVSLRCRRSAAIA